MSVFSKNYTLGFIKEIGEDDVLLTVNGEDIEIKLTNENREQMIEAVSEGIFIVPFDVVNNEIMSDVTDEILVEEFPEYQLEELDGVTDELPVEHE